MKTSLLKVKSIWPQLMTTSLQFMQGMYQETILGNDKAMAELAIAGRCLTDFTLEEVRDYNGSLPRWKRVLNAVRYWRVGTYSISDCE